MKVILKYRTLASYWEIPSSMPRASRIIGMEVTYGGESAIYFDEGVKLIFMLPADTISFHLVASNE
jgi:hypothetical protein